jgi:hypothetical protein
MKYGPRLDVWIVGFLVGACLAGGAYLAVHFNIGGILDSPPRVSAELPPPPRAPDAPATFRHVKKIARVKSSQSKGSSLRGSNADSTELALLEKSDAGIPTVPATSGALASTTLEPERKILKPLGYVQKAGGAVEAIVSEGDGVQVIHVGDTFQKKYTVAEIAPEGVEVVAASARPTLSLPDSSVVSSSNLLNGTSSEAWAYSPAATTRTLDRRQSQVASVSGKPVRALDNGRSVHAVEPTSSDRLAKDRQLALARPIYDSTKPLGYVEKADGTSIDILSEGESVRLVQATNSLESHAVPKGENAKAVMAKLSGLIDLKKGANGQALPTLQADLSPHKPPPGTGMASASGMAGGTNRPLETSTTLGFVERADGKLEAILEDGNGVKLSQFSEPPSPTFLAGINSAKPIGASEAVLSRSEQPLDPIGGPGARIAAVQPSPGSPQTARDTSASSGDSLQAKESSNYGSALPTGFPRQPTPEAEVTVADERVIPEKPPPDLAMVEATLGLVTEGKGSSDREAAILGSLGYANSLGGRASPVAAPFEPAAPPTGPPDSDAEVLRSFGYEEWHYGRGSPIAASLGLNTGAGDSGNLTFLKPLGYLEWQDGRVFAVVSDGEGGVCLVAEGDTLDGRFRVVKISPEEVEIVELPAKKTSSAPVLQFERDAELHSDSVEARGPATSIVELPLERASSTVALVSALAVNSTQVAGARVGKKSVGALVRRTTLRTPPVTNLSPLPPPPDGKLNPQRKGLQSSNPTMASPKIPSPITLRQTSQALPASSASWLASPVLWTRAADWPASRIP